jgi:hypothetical protein
VRADAQVKRLLLLLLRSLCGPLLLLAALLRSAARRLCFGASAAPRAMAMAGSGARVAALSCLRRVVSLRPNVKLWLGQQHFTTVEGVEQALASGRLYLTHLPGFLTETEVEDSSGRTFARGAARLNGARITAHLVWTGETAQQ